MYSKRFINSLALILTTIIFLCMNFFINQRIKNKTETPIRASNEIVEENIIKDEKENNQQVENKQQVEEDSINEENINWQIEIPKISLKAPIEEGTTANILNQSVGHFVETQNVVGNIGLAAHNRGYPVNYFAKIKELSEGDEIIYTYGEIQRTYIVTQNIQISDIDWSYLENTEENKITLITCIENKPEYRRCVQGVEKVSVNEEVEQEQNN